LLKLLPTCKLGVEVDRSLYISLSLRHHVPSTELWPCTGSGWLSSSHRAHSLKVWAWRWQPAVQSSMHTTDACGRAPTSPAAPSVTLPA